jgi:hypothetical protein
VSGCHCKKYCLSAVPDGTSLFFARDTSDVLPIFFVSLDFFFRHFFCVKTKEVTAIFFTLSKKATTIFFNLVLWHSHHFVAVILFLLLRRDVTMSNIVTEGFFTSVMSTWPLPFTIYLYLTPIYSSLCTVSGENAGKHTAIYSAPPSFGELYCTHSDFATKIPCPALTSYVFSFVRTCNVPLSTTVYSSKSGRCAGSSHPAGLCMRAILTAAVLLFTLPKYSSMIFFFVPAASMICGRSMNVTIVCDTSTMYHLPISHKLSLVFVLRLRLFFRLPSTISFFIPVPACRT